MGYLHMVRMRDGEPRTSTTLTLKQQQEAAQAQAVGEPDCSSVDKEVSSSHTAGVKETGLLIAGSALPNICVVASLPLFQLPPSLLLPIYSSLGWRLETYIKIEVYSMKKCI